MTKIAGTLREDIACLVIHHGWKSVCWCRDSNCGCSLLSGKVL